MQQSRIFEVFEELRGKRRFIYTKSLVPGFNVYGERTKKDKGVEYREWDPSRSKLGAAIMKGCPNLFIRKGQTILYLGAATGTTVSHVSDMVGEDGFIFALDFAPRVVRDLVFVCEKRKNIAPLLFDAHHPETYKDNITEVDLIFQDIAQKDQVNIFLKNIDMHLKKGGYALLAVKSRSIDVTKKPNIIFKMVLKQLEEKIKVIDSKDLGPYEKDHMLYICKK